MTEQMTRTNKISPGCHKVVHQCGYFTRLLHSVSNTSLSQACLDQVQGVTRVVTLQQPCHQVVTSLAFLYGNPNRDRTPQRMESPVDRVAGLSGLTIQAHCLSGYTHPPPPQPLTQLLTQAVLPSCKPGCGNNLLWSLVVIHMMYVMYVLHKLYN